MRYKLACNSASGIKRVCGSAEVAARRTGCDDDAVDDFTDGVGCLRSVVGMIECGSQAFDPALVGFLRVPECVWLFLTRLSLVEAVEFQQPIPTHFSE